MEITKRSEEVIATIRAMNRCWTGGWNEAQFRQYINPDPVALVPTTSGNARRAGGLRSHLAGI